MAPDGRTDTSRGTIEFICGCMFSGKTLLLMERVAAARNNDIPVAVFKHASDDRYAEHQLVSHNGHRIGATPLVQAARLRELAGEARLIAIDEVQFFGPELLEIVQDLAGSGRDVVLAGLDLDSWGLPFGPASELQRTADRVTHTYARCAVCGEKADHTQRVLPVEGQKMVGGAEAYEPRCTRCFEAPPPELRR